MTYGHSPTESLVAIFEGEDRDTGLDLVLLEEIAAYFREVRKKYVNFEGSLKGVDSRILVAQVPGGMLTNMEGQLKEQNAVDRLDEVLSEIPSVRKDLGYIPLVTPTSQIVGTQAVLNVLSGERYKSITKETAGVLKGEYGLAPAPFDEALQKRVLDGAEPITCRPADLLDDEMDKLTAELNTLAKEKNITLAKDQVDDVLTYALFNQVGLKFLEKRNNPDAFEPVPTGKLASSNESGVYTVKVDGKSYVVEVNDGGDVEAIAALGQAATVTADGSLDSKDGKPVSAVMSGVVFKVCVSAGQHVNQGDVLMVLEVMKMENDIVAPRSGQVLSINAKEGDSVSVGDCLFMLS